MFALETSSCTTTIGVFLFFCASFCYVLAQASTKLPSYQQKIDRINNSDLIWITKVPWEKFHNPERKISKI